MQAVNSFDDGARLVVGYLSSRYPLGSWSVNRRAGDRHRVLIGSGVAPGESTPWADTPCAAVAGGRAPRSTVDALADPAFRSLPVVRNLRLRAYTGVGLHDADGTLFGTLCGSDRRRMPPELLGEAQAVMDVFAALLEGLLRGDRERLTLARLEEASDPSAGTDLLTGLRNRQGWDAAVGLEAERLVRYGDPAVVVVVDLDDLGGTNANHGRGAGDALLRRTAALLTAAVRGSDVLARLGGDEFAWLLMGISAEEASSRVAMLWDALLSGGVEASMGWAALGPAGLGRAIDLADERMHAAKRRRRSPDPESPGSAR